MRRSLKDQYVLFICPTDIFGAGLPIYSFQNFAVENKNVALDDRTFKCFYIFKEYKKLPDTHPLKKYLKYFATNAADSVETKEIDSKVEWYKTDGLTQERYMTWEQEIQLAVENERQRNEKVIAEQSKALAEQSNALAEKDRRIAELEAKLAAK